MAILVLVGVVPGGFGEVKRPLGGIRTDRRGGEGHEATLTEGQEEPHAGQHGADGATHPAEEGAGGVGRQQDHRYAVHHGADHLQNNTEQVSTHKEHRTS